ncbi:phospho-sugar mutase [Fulvivirgaceae bacterium BMA12]|uniref:Phospho-sugar mutase n=1 Tax=Agaribacillus aureus TaxID=3051825 RepID=A0ABT8LC87_9BACT|nr:phospho-sugar mutase [Fulvivirgaceae bacterium BMA12]
MEQIIIEKAEKWLNSNIDEDAKATIKNLLSPGNETELTDSFYKDLEFGTGGLRGIMGIGSNRINKYTIGMATQGLANYLLKSFPSESLKVAIAHDSRNNSKFFAETTAAVFSANGIKVYFFEDLRPTPELSFAIRQLGCQSGVVITASHNPKEYNGYKAYWNDGAQLVPPHDKNVINEVNAIKSVDDVKFDRDDNNIEVIGKEIDEIYLNAIKNLSLAPEAVSRQKDLKIVFSPIHGTGITLVPPILEKFGFENVYVVQEQSVPDGNFPTVVYPNPEESEAMSIALKQAEEIDADLVMATDPDSDRVGIAAKDNHGDFKLLNGNQTGSLLIYYLLKKWQENGKLDGKQYIVKTIVTSDLINQIASAYNVDCYDTLTGFKYIAALIKQLENEKEFIGGGEESYGYLISDFVRDKDAIASCAMIAEMAAYVKDQGKSIFDFLLDMYDEFGLYNEKLISITKKGKSGAEEIEKMMFDLRNNLPESLNGSKLVKAIDYQSGIAKNLVSGEETKVDFPASNVLQLFTEDGCKISARPSGTEPKIKFYFSVNKKLTGKEAFDDNLAELNQKIDSIISELNLN